MIPAPSPTILIVDGDEGRAILIRENLQAAGLTHAIEHFSDGQAVLDFFASGRPRPDEKYLVLLDIRMPKVDGIEVLRQMKADPELRKIPVIVLTTSDDTGEMERCHKIGCSGYIQKPVDYEKFAEAIRGIGYLVPQLLVPQIGKR